MRAWLDYTRDDRPLSFWRDYQQHEVDFVIGDEIGIEVKGTDMATEKHLKGLGMLGQEIPLKHKLLISLDPAPRMIDGVEILPWKEFLTRLWGGAYRM